MNSLPTCPKCGKPLPASAPRQLCPECLLRAGFPTGTQPSPKQPAIAPPAPAELAPHFPQLEILECIGAGGMGAVYRARQPALDRLVALKILRPPTGDDPGFAERFVREARALAKLSHPNIVAVHDYGQAGGHHYLLMEFVDGMNLRQLLNAGTISPKEALAIVPPICDALQYAHDQGIVHRDIKPENILLGKNGTVKLADFGLAKLAGAAGASLTAVGDVMGTPHYMAPEQVEKPREVDHRADIYSLGVVFYQMLTGELPLGRFGPPSRKVQIDVRLDEIVLRALEKEPELRYQQASALRAEVETVTQTSPPATKDETTNARTDGNLLIVPTDNAHLPLRCIKTNELVTATEARRKEFVWFPPIIWLSLFMTPVAFIILYYLFRRSVVLDVPLSAAGRRQVRRHFLIATCLTAGGALALVAIIMNAYAGRWTGLGGGGFVLLIMLGLVALIAGLSHDSRRGMVLRTVKLQDGRLWLAGAGPAFLASLPRDGTTVLSPTPRHTPGPVILVTLCLLLALPASLWFRSRWSSERQTLPKIGTAQQSPPIAIAADNEPMADRATTTLETNPSVPADHSGQAQRTPKKFQYLPPAIGSTFVAVPPPKITSELSTDFDRMESNPKILRIMLQQAEKTVSQTESRYRAGLATNQDVNEARAAVSLLGARLSGDRVEFARVQLAAAEVRLQMTSARYDAGVAESSERDKTKTEWEIAKVRLLEAENSVQQTSRDDDQPKH